MKKLVYLFLIFTTISCNDGDFDVPSFEFSSVVSSCDEYLLYVKNSNSTEVLALPLSITQIGTEEGSAIFNISSNLTATYRLFDDGIGTNYFCQKIPSFSPNVLKELYADSGTINIVTTAIKTDGIITGYTYDISFTDLLFFDTNDERIFFESFEFGTFTLTL